MFTQKRRGKLGVERGGTGEQTGGQTERQAESTKDKTDTELIIQRNTAVRSRLSLKYSQKNPFTYFQIKSKCERDTLS